MSSLVVQALDLVQSTQVDLAPCGPATLALVDRLNRLLITPNASPQPTATSPPASAALHQALALSEALFRLADEQLLAYPYKLVPECWRRLYTDATLLGVLAQLRLAEGNGEDEGRGVKAAEELVRKLDMVLIVAGAPGEGRSAVTHSLITYVQQTYLAAPFDSPRPPKRRRLSPPPSPPTPPPPLPSPHVTRPIRRFDAPPSLDEFIALLRDPKPFVISGGCADWPAAEKWDASYLASKVGAGRVVPVEAGGDYTKAGWGQKILPFQTFLDRLEVRADDSAPVSAEEDASPASFATADSDDDPDLDPSALPPPSVPLYLAQHDLFRQFPALLDDLAIPDYVYACPGPPADYPTYSPPATADGYVLNGWLGPAGTVSPAHTDPFFNLYAQVKGKKWVWVAPPGVAGDMAAFGGEGHVDEEEEGEEGDAQEGGEHAALDGDGGARAGDGEEEDGEAGGSAELMTNTARVDVTLSPDDPGLRKRHPGFVERVASVAEQAVLEAGDLLFLPPGWWHAMKSLSVSFSVSIWF